MENIPHPFQNEIIAIIEKYLKQESSAILATDMSDSYKSNMLRDFDCDPADTDDVVGFFPDEVSLGSFVSIFTSKPSTNGILFLKNMFCYKKGIFYDIEKMDYSDIKFIDSKITNLVLYKNKIDTLKLSGISFVEPGCIPKLFSEIHALNDDTVEITAKDKLKNFAIKAAEAVIDDAISTQKRAEYNLRKADRDAEYVLKHSDSFSDEAVQKASNHLENENRYKLEELKYTLEGVKGEVDSLYENRKYDE